MSWSSFASGVRVRVYVVADGSGAFVVTENDVSAVACEVPQRFEPWATIEGSVVAELLSVSVKSVESNDRAAPLAGASLQRTGSEKVIVMVLVPTAPVTAVIVGGVVSGAVAVA
jgi:hypothetical protein